MTNPFADTLHLRVRPSAIHQTLVLLLYGMAAVVTAILAVHRPVLWLVLIGVAIAGWHAWRRACLRAARSIVRIRCGADGVWRWQLASGAWHEGQPASAVCAGDRIVCLGLRPSTARYRIFTSPLFRDALAERGHRHLRARLTIVRTAEHASGHARS